MILCDECGVRPAMIHVTAIVNGDKQDINLCQECASRRKEFAMHLTALADKLGLMNKNVRMGFRQAEGAAKAARVPAITCPSCGTTYATFLSKGTMGCAQCYDAFRTPLTGWLKEKCGAAMHVGSSAGTVTERMQLTRLRNAQKVAVANEQYELAAQLRDQIRELSHRLEDGSDE